MSAKALSQLIFLSGASTDPYTTRLVNPANGSSVWSFKGVQLQNGTPSVFIPLGDAGDQLLIAVREQPLLHLIGLSTTKRLHVKSILAKKVTAIVTDKTGSFVFGALGNAIYAWSSLTRELISVSEVQYLNITALAMSPDNAYVIAGGEDGSISVSLITDLVSQKPPGVSTVDSFHTYSAHSREVNAISVSASLEPRILSVDNANTAVVYSLAAKTVLFRCSDDYPLTACCFSSNESRFFVGNKVGSITAVSMTKRVMAPEEHINFDDNNGPYVRFTKKHVTPITNIAISFDDSALVSGDAQGIFVIWNVSNGSILSHGNLKGPVITARFVRPWKSIFQDKYNPPKTETLPFHKHPAKSAVELPLVHAALPAQQLQKSVQSDFQNYLARIIAEYKTNSGEVAIPVSIDKNGKETPASLPATNNGPDIVLHDHALLIERVRLLEEENQKLKDANQELSEMALSAITDDI